MEGLTQGRMVHFVPTKGFRHYAAVVTNVWNEAGTVNLFVFPDSSYPEHKGGSVTSVRFDSSSNPDAQTWHWIEKV